MSIQTRIIEKAYPKAVSARANQTLRNEASKGCVGKIYNSPVSLEPTYKPPTEWNQISNEFLHADPIKRVAKHKKIIRLAVMAACLALMQFTGTFASAQPFSLKVIEGEWARIDGDYTISVQNVSSEGKAEVKYFNPGTINVAQSSIAFHNGRVGLYVKLQDKGYPGSTYNLYYYAEKDLLAGVYYQAGTGKKYEVIFERKK